MRTLNITLVHQTVSLSFERAVSMIGGTTRDLVYSLLLRKGIGKEDISTRFEDVEKTLVQLFGESARFILIATLAKFCEEYSLQMNMQNSGSPTISLNQLVERVLVEKRLPKHFTSRHDTKTFEDKTGLMAPWSG